MDHLQRRHPSSYNRTKPTRTDSSTSTASFLEHFLKLNPQQNSNSQFSAVYSLQQFRCRPSSKSPSPTNRLMSKHKCNMGSSSPRECKVEITVEQIDSDFDHFNMSWFSTKSRTSLGRLESEVYLPSEYGIQTNPLQGEPIDKPTIRITRPSVT